MTDIIPIPAIIDVDGKADVDIIKDSHLQILGYKQSIVDKNVKLLDVALDFLCSSMLPNAVKQRMSHSGFDVDVEVKCDITDVDDTWFGYSNRSQEYMQAVFKAYIVDCHQKSRSYCEPFDATVYCSWLHSHSYVSSLMAADDRFMPRSTRAAANKLILRWMLFSRLFTMHDMSGTNAVDPYRFAPMRTELEFKCLQTNVSSPSGSFFKHSECTIDASLTLEVPHFSTIEDVIAELVFEGLDISKVL